MTTKPFNSAQHDFLWWQRLGVALCVGWCSAQVGLFDVYVGTDGITSKGILPVWAYSILVNGTLLVGLILLVLSQRRREAMLASFFALGAGALATPPFSGTLDNATTLTRVIIATPIEAFQPFFLWSFFREFPSSVQAHYLDRPFAIIQHLSFAVALYFLACAALPDLWLATALHRSAFDSYFWAVLLSLMLPTIPFAIIRARSSLGEERVRVLLFLTILAGTLTPFLGIIALSLHDGTREWLLSERVTPFSVALTLLFSGFFLVGTSYTVLTDNLFSMRIKLQDGLRYLLAKYLVDFAVWLPTLITVTFVWQQRYQPLVDIFNQTSPLMLLSIGILQTGLVGVRGRLANFVDQRFFRSNVDTTRLLLKANNQFLLAESTNQLAAYAHQLLSLELGVQRTSLLTLTSELEFQDSQHVTPSVHSHLIDDLETYMPDGRVVNDPLIPNEPAAQWIREQEVEVLHILRAPATDQKIGLFICSAKRSNTEFTAGEHALILSLARLAALKLADLLRGKGDPTIDPETINPLPSSAALQLQSPTSGPTNEQMIHFLCSHCGQLYVHALDSCALCDIPLDPTSVPLLLGNRYRLHSLVGTGATADVYKALDTYLERLVAVKMLKSVQSMSNKLLLREARLIASVSHPRLAQIYGIDFHYDQAFMVMEFMQGGTVRDSISRGALNNQELWILVRSVLEGLSYLHRRGYVHGDIKPENIGFNQDGEPKLLDFGISRLIGSISSGLERVNLADGSLTPNLSIATGTTTYQSPWLIRGDLVNPTSDIWALGITAYEAACRRSPFAGRTSSAVKRAILLDKPKALSRLNSSIDPQLSQWIMDIIESKDISTNYSADHLLTTLAAITPTGA